MQLEEAAQACSFHPVAAHSDRLDPIGTCGEFFQ